MFSRQALPPNTIADKENQVVRKHYELPSLTIKELMNMYAADICFIYIVFGVKVTLSRLLF